MMIHTMLFRSKEAFDKLFQRDANGRRRVASADASCFRLTSAFAARSSALCGSGMDRKRPSLIPASCVDSGCVASRCSSSVLSTLANFYGAFIDTQPPSNTTPRCFAVLQYTMHRRSFFNDASYQRFTPTCAASLFLTRKQLLRILLSTGLPFLAILLSTTSVSLSHLINEEDFQARPLLRSRHHSTCLCREPPV